MECSILFIAKSGSNVLLLNFNRMISLVIIYAICNYLFAVVIYSYPEIFATYTDELNFINT